MNKDSFGTEPLSKLLKAQSIPASIGILVMSVYGIVDTIFVGRWVGAYGIGAITVVMPITFLISSIGMAIGVGGASIISRAFGEKNDKKAFAVFGNQIMLTLMLALLFVLLGYVYQDSILNAFGGKGEILEPAKAYFGITLIGVPFLAWAMMSNNVIRAEGYPKIAMYTLLLPAITNIVLDPIFIIVFDMGIEGAAWATSISYIICASFTLWFFIWGKSQIKINLRCIRPNFPIIKEIGAIGSVTLARQGAISLLSVVLNNTLFIYGGEMALSAYGIASRMLMFANFPVLGITQGTVPILGYNYGAKLYTRVQDLIKLSMKSATIIAFVIFTLIMGFTEYIVEAFTNDMELIEQTIPALRLIFLATPLIAINMIGSAYFQSIGKAIPALLLTLSKQGFFLIPLILILPKYFGLYGAWYAFPIADIGATTVTYLFLHRETNKLKQR
ncbi:MATE family efflux transporter [Flavicella marina]|uniref:MATE family efflux transporter n=1 Tax=Flavicella marina TaxID=1475951 RepID=UPI0012657050|nr:MATE family efflux transporter [Flavicella marina]